jgi:nitric oxide reductase NorE protein
MNEATETPTFLWVGDGPVLERRPEVDTTQHDRRIPAEAGLWVFVLGDMTIFGTFFAVFAKELSADPAAFERAATSLHQPIGALNTLVLLLSSYFVVVALRGRSGRGAASTPWLVGAMACGGAFMVSKAIEYTLELSAGNTPGSGTFFTFYYVLTGVHVLHVVIGVTLLGVWWRGSRRGVAVSRVFREGAAIYWHMVDLLWLVIFALLYLASSG